MRKLLPAVAALATLVFCAPAAGVEPEGFTLPDGRGWEMVSPVDKNGGSIQGPGGIFGGGVLQAAAAGSSVTYSSSSSFANAQGAPGASQYLSRRGSTGWSTENITLPTLSAAYGTDPDGVPYQLFSTDLADAIVLEGHRCEEGEPCPRSYTLRDQTSGDLTPLPYEEPDLRFAGATPDLSQLAFTTCAALTADAIEFPVLGGCDPGARNLYLRSGGALRLINLLPGQSVGTPGAALAAQARAISDDGSRVYWTDGSDLYLRDGDETLQVDGDAGGGGQFQTASPGGEVAFFTAPDGDLWRYDAVADAATDLTPAGGVQGVLGASDSGAVVYYAGAGGLFMWRGGTSTPVASQANASNYPPSTGTARVSSDGLHLAFLSSAALTAYDNAGFTEVYLYTAPAGAGSGSLVCASCSPAKKAPVGAASLPGASPNGTDPGATRVYKPRVLTADSKRLFFDTFDSLVIDDTNQDRDVYQWEAQGTGTCTTTGGCVSLISSGRAEGGASFVDASASGADVYFLTDGSLVPSDPGGSVDLYDARVGGGFPIPDPESICIGDACQPLPPEPEDPTPGTLRPGSPNPSLPVTKPVTKCKKGQVRKKGKCVKKKRRHRNRSGSGR
jgi:hypothetical protein